MIAATFALLTLAILALWAGGGDGSSAFRRFLWLPLLAAAVTAGLIGSILEPIALGWIALFGGATWLFARVETKPPVRVAAAVALLVLAAGCMLHLLPGFQNPRLLSEIRFSPDALPYRLYLNFDKPLVGLFIIGLLHRRLADFAAWRRMLAATAPVATATLLLVLLLSLAAGYVRFAPKFPPATWLWLWVNLCFTCFAEEALFRGFIQAQLQLRWARMPRGDWLALGVAAVLFGLAHAGGGAAYVALATVAGAGYGWAYLRSGRIEASILTHFTLNTAHFLLFTYPALDRAAAG